MKTAAHCILLAIIVTLAGSLPAQNSQPATAKQQQQDSVTVPLSAAQPYFHPSAFAARFSAEQLQANAWDTLTKGISDKKVANRIAAVDALTTIGGSPRAIAMAQTALSDRDPAVRVEAINRLSDMGVRDAVPKIKQLLNDKSPDVVFAAARALAAMGTSDGRDVLIEVVTGERKMSGGVVASGMSWARQQASSPLTLALMGAGQAASILVAPYASVGVVAIRELMTDHYGPDRAISAESLGSDGSERVVNVLVEALRDKNWTVRAAAADALGRSGAPHAISDLTPLLKDDKPTVRYMAAASIIRLGTPRMDLSNNIATPQVPSQ